MLRHLTWGTSSLALLLALATGVLGCSLARTGVGEGDAGTGLDATPRDATIDAPERDAEPIDAPMDDDGGVDSGPIDGGFDGGPVDGGTDSGPVDAGTDAPFDSGPCGACAAPRMCCDGICIDPRTDILHCGGCSPCPTGPSSTPTCMGGVCDLACTIGFEDCDGMAGTGCEANLSSLSTCRSCSACAMPANGTAMCGVAGCEYACTAPFEDCDTSTPDCESDLSTSGDHCGRCGNSCAPGRTCSASSCHGWTTTATSGAPSARFEHSAVWTGSRMIVWGGRAMSALGDGASYDPVMDRWTPISSTGAPSARYSHVAVWTGTRMIIWGGYNGSEWQSSGAAYDPVTDTWTALPAMTAPEGRSRTPSIWSGAELVVWGGWTPSDATSATGGRYDPLMNSWRTTSGSMAPEGRRFHAGDWTGSVVVYWAGDVAGFTGETNSGGRYNPVTDTWAGMATSGAPSARQQAVGVYTAGAGTPRFVAWGGFDARVVGGDAYFDDGGRYDPVGDAWTSMADSPLSGRTRHVGVWTGSRVIFHGGRDAAGVLGDAAAYDHVANTWALLPAAGAPAARAEHTAVWTGSELIVWGGNGAGGALSSGGRWAP